MRKVADKLLAKLKKYIPEKLALDITLEIYEDTLKELTLSKVEEFAHVFSHTVTPYNDRKTVPIPDEVALMRMKLITEELAELIAAQTTAVREAMVTHFYGVIDGMKEDIDSSDVKTKYSLLDSLDALVDLQYVIDGTTLAFGLASVFYDAFDVVHENNMSKAARNLVQAHETITHYKSLGIKAECEVSTIRDKVYYAIKVAESVEGALPKGKVLKPKGYRKVELYKFI